MPEQPVVVTPIQPEHSRTLRTAWLMQVWTFILGIAPDLVEMFLYLTVNDPKFAETVSEWFPRPLRYAAMAAIMGYAQRNKQLRRITAAPIAGTPLAEAQLKEDK
jgi:hypothetical protein